MASSDRCIVLPTSRPDSYLGEEDMSATAKDVIKDAKLLELLQLAMDQGWEVKPTNNGKLLWYPKDKEMPAVPSPTRLVGRTLANVRTALERSGLDTSSLKNDKAKKKRGAVMVTDHVAESVEDLSPQEQAHATFQNLLSDQLTEIVSELPNFQPSATELINTEIDVFLVQNGKALMEFMERTKDAFGCNHQVDEQLQAKLEEAERLYLETCQELEQLRRHADKLEAKVTSLGTDYAEVSQRAADNLERANKAENRLRALRTALTED